MAIQTASSDPLSTSLPPRTVKPVAYLEAVEQLIARAMLKNPSEAAIRSLLRHHRFSVFNWLRANYTHIPMSLQSHEAHPQVGSQSVDTSLFVNRDA